MEWPKITKETPLEEIKHIHQLIWDYVLEHGRKPITPYHSNCVACEYVFLTMIEKFYCNACPIAWKDGKICSMTYSTYDTWYEAVSENRSGLAKEYAKQIQDMPFKYELGDS